MTNPLVHRSPGFSRAVFCFPLAVLHSGASPAPALFKYVWEHIETSNAKSHLI